MPFDIHKYSQETVYGLIVFSLILLFVGIALSWIRPWWAGCVALMLICDLGIYIAFAHFDPQSKDANPSDAPTTQASLATQSAPRFRIKRTTAVILAGTNRLSFTLDAAGNSDPRSPVAPRIGDNPLLFYAKNGVVSVLATFTNGAGRAKIDGLDIIDPPPDWEINQDDSGLEIVDSTGQPVFQLMTINDTTLQVAGCFVNDQGKYMIIGPISISGADNPEQARRALAPLRPIFKYPSSRFKSQRRPKSSQEPPIGYKSFDLTFELRKYANQVVNLEAPADDPDADVWLADLAQLLSGSIWNVNTTIGGDKYKSDGIDNLMVGISSIDAKASQIPQSAVDLLQVFKKFDLVNQNEQLRLLDGLPSKEITVRIGIKPSTKPKPN